MEFLVVDKQLTPLIGAKAAQQMGLITVNLQNFKITEPPALSKAGVKSVQTMEEIVAHYPEIFQREIGTLPETVHLEVDQCATPVVAPPRRVPTSLKTKLKQELDRLQQLEVIAPIDEPTPWVSSLAVAVKNLHRSKTTEHRTEERKILTFGAGGHTSRTLESKGVFHLRSEIWLLALCPLA